MEGWLCPPHEFSVEVLTHRTAEPHSGDKNLYREIKFALGHKVGPNLIGRLTAGNSDPEIQVEGRGKEKTSTYQLGRGSWDRSFPQLTVLFASPTGRL